MLLVLWGLYDRCFVELNESGNKHIDKQFQNISANVTRLFYELTYYIEIRVFLYYQIVC